MDIIILFSNLDKSYSAVAYRPDTLALEAMSCQRNLLKRSVQWTVSSPWEPSQTDTSPTHLSQAAPVPQSARTEGLYLFQWRQLPRWTASGENTGVMQSPLIPARLGSFWHFLTMARRGALKAGMALTFRAQQQGEFPLSVPSPVEQLLQFQCGAQDEKKVLWGAGKTVGTRTGSSSAHLSPCHPHLSPLQCFNRSCHYSLNTLHSSLSSWIMERRAAHREFASSHHTSTKTR